MLAITIKAGKISKQDIGAGLKAMQDLVGGYVEPFFTKRSPVAAGDITGYVNEEGLMIGLPIDFGVFHSPDYIVPLAGDAVIVGLDEEGETRGLTEDEAALILKRYRKPLGGVCPVVEGRITNPLTLIPVEGVLTLSGL